MDIRGAVVAEISVLARAAIVGAVFYAVWGFMSGSGTTWAGYAAVVAVLFVAANVVFAVARRRRPDVVELARAIEEEA